MNHQFYINSSNNEIDNELDNEIDNEIDNELDNEIDNELDNEIDNEIDNELDNEIDNEIFLDPLNEIDETSNVLKWKEKIPNIKLMTEDKIESLAKNDIDIIIAQELANTNSEIIKINDTYMPNDTHMPNDITIDNIQLLLHPYILNTERKTTMESLLFRLINDVNNIIGNQNRKKFIIIIFTALIGFKDILNMPNMSKYVLVIKVKFHEFIMKFRTYDLIPIYNQIFNDEIYSHIQLRLTRDVINQDEIQCLINKYHSNIEDLKNQRIQLRTLPKFDEDEIVGAKDKEGRWWMSKILKVFKHMEHNMYYVEFLGWGPKFNEFIVDSYRISYFNPRKHIYYRPSLKHKHNLNDQVKSC
jgi:hypothetical protein